MTPSNRPWIAPEVHVLRAASQALVGTTSYDPFESTDSGPSGLST